MSSLFMLNHRLPFPPGGGANDFLSTESRYIDTALDEFNNEQVFKSLEQVRKELTLVQLENMLLEDFLEKNDPKLLIGVTNALQFSQKTPRIHFTGLNSITRQRRTDEYGGYFRTRSIDKGSFSGTIEDDSSSTKTTMSFSRCTATSTRTMESPRLAADYRINYSMKIELAEKLTDEINDKLAAIESKSLAEMKELIANLQELRLTNDETIQTMEALQKFVTSSMSDQLGGRLQAEKFIRFINDWLKNGMALVGKFRLRIMSLKQQYRSQKIVLNKKADLSVILRPIDFEKLQIERCEFMKQIEEKNGHLVALKKVTSHATLKLNQNQKKLKLIETQYKQLCFEASAVEEHINRLEKEATSVQDDIFKCEVSIENLQKDISDYAAPSILNYVNKKHKLSCLEKEKNFLKRQIYILEIKLSNIKTKYRTSRKVGGIKERIENK